MSNGNMYEFIGETWNPLNGQCPHNCPYCSTNKLKKRFPVMRELYSGEIRINERQLNRKLSVINNIFVCAQNDLFAEGNEFEIATILGRCVNDKRGNRFFFQTKNPAGFHGWRYPIESTFIITLESNRFYEKYMGNTRHPKLRVADFATFEKQHKQITIEPIMDFDLDEFVSLIRICDIEQVNIGADSGKNGLPEPSKEKLESLIIALKKFTKVHLKNNLKRLLA